MIHYFVSTDQYGLAMKYPFRAEVKDVTATDVMDNFHDMPEERRVVFMAMSIKNPKTNHRPLKYGGKNAPKTDSYHRLVFCR